MANHEYYIDFKGDLKEKLPFFAGGDLAQKEKGFL